MRVALDYDETFTAAPVLWKQFVELAKQHGHDVKFVTYRDSRWGNHDISADAYDLGIDIVFTNGKQKETVYKADIWIDDSPETIVSFDKLVKKDLGDIMFKKYYFNVTIYDQEDSVVEKRKEVWQDRGESVAKDLLRLAIQDMWKLDNGYWPRVELYCTNPDIKNYKEDDEHY